MWLIEFESLYLLVYESKTPGFDVLMKNFDNLRNWIFLAGDNGVPFHGMRVVKGSGAIATIVSQERPILDGIWIRGL